MNLRWHLHLPRDTGPALVRALATYERARLDLQRQRAPTPVAIGALQQASLELSRVAPAEALPPVLAQPLWSEPALPGSVREAASRSYLPGEFEPQREALTRALAHLPDGALLRALYLQAVAPAHAAVQEELQQVARESLPQLGKWARRAALDAVRRRVLSLAQEPLPPSPVRPEAWVQADPAPLDLAIGALWARIDAVHADLRLWNSLTPPGWKLRVWPERFPTLQAFHQAPRPGLHALLQQLAAHSARGALLRME